MSCTFTRSLEGVKEIGRFDDGCVLGVLATVRYKMFIINLVKSVCPLVTNEVSWNFILGTFTKISRRHIPLLVNVGEEQPRMKTYMRFCARSDWFGNNKPDRFPRNHAGNPRLWGRRRHSQSSNPGQHAVTATLYEHFVTCFCTELCIHYQWLHWN